MIGFKVYWSTYEKLVATVILDDGKPILKYACNEGVQQDFERFITKGLSQFIGKPGDRKARHTPPDHPLFLQRLKDYLGVVYGFGIFDIDNCCIHPGSSRMCEEGAKGCEVRHRDVSAQCRICTKQ